MSHTATITLNLNELEKEQINSLCDENINFIDTALNSGQYKNTEILEKSLKELRKIKSSIVLSILVTEFEASRLGEKGFFKEQFDKIQKLVFNVIRTIDYSRIEAKKIENFEHYVYEFGSIAYSALEILKQNQIELTENNLSDQIDKLINEYATIDELKSFKNEIYKAVDNLKDIKIKEYFLSKMQNIKTKLHINEFYVWYQDQISTLKNNDEIIKPFQHFLLTHEKYTLQGKRVLVENDLLHSYYIFENNLGEQVQLIVSPDGSVKYEIGDYVNHVCTKTAKQMLNYIENNSKMKVIKHQVNRVFIPTKPKYKAKEKIRQWGS